MRKISMIVIHCDGIMPHQHNTIAKIDAYHRSKGWKCVGYHEFVHRDGTVEHGRNIAEPGAHVVGHNLHSIGLCYEGGLNSAGEPEDTRTPDQVRALRQLVERYHAYFPDAVIVGHHDLNPGKACPCFDAVKEYWDLQPVR
jgi:hypothetical protein